MPVALNNVSVLGFRGSDCHGHASWGTWAEVKVWHWGLWCVIYFPSFKPLEISGSNLKGEYVTGHTQFGITF